MRKVQIQRITAGYAAVLMVCGGCLAASAQNTALAQKTMMFTCGKAAKSALPLSAATRYTAPAAAGDAAAAPAYGFDLVASPDQVAGDSCASDKPFFFSVAVPDGNYQVTLVLGSGQTSTTTVRAESRRLFVDKQYVAAGKSATEVFNVNVRTEDIAGATGPGAKVRLKPREIGALDWDEKLTLEFNGEHPSVRSISVKPINDVPTVYMAGDSTMVDQDKEPWAAWGQMLPVFFGPKVVIANDAESGETIRSFTGERRFDKIMSTIKAGDYLMIQFAHNDQKNGSPETTDFSGSLAKYVDAVTAKGAHPILVTAMNRRTFDAEGHITDSLGGYPQATRAFAEEHKLPLIDLNALSKTLFEAMGQDGTLKAFVHYPANTFPGQTTEMKDDTHFNSYGAYELARAVVQNIRDQKLPLAADLKPGIPVFNPAQPDNVAKFELPQSPLFDLQKPYGK
jgi:lysophospholipase L1-like esterase